jgi:hypothetical protein
VSARSPMRFRIYAAASRSLPLLKRNLDMGL